MIASGALLVILGVWLLLQTIAGDLPGRVLSWAKGSGATPGPTQPAAQGRSGFNPGGDDTSGGGGTGGGGTGGGGGGGGSW